jgi:hypothetical protein
MHERQGAGKGTLTHRPSGSPIIAVLARRFPREFFSMQDFEKLGVFYLGREYDLASRTEKPDLLLYDAKDLTTHAVCVGMTGSGKTGLCLALLEEAAIDGVPAIAIDPKGDLGNLLLTFPELRPADFRPWIEESDAARKGVSPDDLAAQTAGQWREGLAKWGKDGARIEKFRSAADVAIYTPGSNAGLPLTVLKSFAAPTAAVLADGDALRERVGAAASGLLALVGVEVDPINSREHILLSQLLDQAWRKQQDLDIGALVRGIQSPPFDRVGVVDLESFYPVKERAALAMRLNNLLASPSFAGWMEGEPLDVARLLHTPAGRPRLSILSIAHLAEPERMFFVTILLNEILSWVRSQPGTSSLRAILYMDEVFGYFPPTANPPSKTPMLTLLKQARAYGLGIVLATQNPVDLDYKGLSNTGTWFLGRLQTERDKARVLDGLEGASAVTGLKFNRSQMEATLGALGARVFLMNNVHDEGPVVFESRWCLSYLRGPLVRGQIQTLMSAYRQRSSGQASAAPAPPPSGSDKPAQAAAPTATVARPAAGAAGQRPLVAAEAGEFFMPRRTAAGASVPLVYRPALFGAARLHFVDAKAKVDHWQAVSILVSVDNDLADSMWDQTQTVVENESDFKEQPEPGADFAPLPSELSQPKNYAKWRKSLAEHLYRTETLSLWSAPLLKEVSRPGESQAEFRIRLQQRAREERDQAVARLRQKYAAKIAASDNQVRRAQDRVAREKSQLQNQTLQTVVWVGSSILRALMGRKGTSLSGAASAARSAGRSAGKHGDIGRANAELEAMQQKHADLAAQVQAEIAQLDTASAEVELAEYVVRPRKSDISVRKVALAWVN